MSIDLRKFYNDLIDRPLGPGDAFYVDYVSRGGQSKDPIKQMATRIDYQQSESVTILTGHRGSGKSTELLRLADILEKQGCVVFIGNMREYVNLTTPIEITDFLISIMLAFSEGIKGRYGADPAGKSYLDRLVFWLGSQVKIEEFGVGFDETNLKFSIKEDTDFKQRMQEKLKGHVSALIGQARIFAQEAVALIREKERDGDKKVVYIVDSLEQLRGVGASGAVAVYDSVENLFSGHAASLAFPSLHLVYTIPPYLPTLAPGIGRVLGGDVLRNLPSIHVYKLAVDAATGDRRCEVDEDGVGIMVEIIGKRCGDWNVLFTREKLRMLALASGGDVRDFLRLVQSCIVKMDGRAGAVDEEVIELAKADLKREMLPIAADDREWLKRIHRSKTAELETSANLHHLARFFDSNLVLNYRNGDDWYDVHPLILEELGEKPLSCG